VKKNRPYHAARCLTTFALGLASALIAVGPSGCGSGVTGMVEGPEYPFQRKQSKTLDVQAVREETILTVTNTTAHTLPACRMWVNQWFSWPFPGLAVGETVEIPLADFKDKFGETFRAGGFFAIDRPAKVVLAQLELEGELVGLVVVGEQ
jgi:hypothetical protein